MPDLKEILGEHFSEELAKAISTAYGKETVSKEDFNKRGATIKGHEETIKTLTEQLDSLKNASPDIEALREQLKESESLFKKEGGSSVHINGAQPSEPGNTMDPNGSSDFEARLAAAKESGDLAQISYIKRTAAEKGIILN